MLLQAARTAATSIFTDDFVGYVKLIIAVASIGATMGGLLFWWLKKRDDSWRAEFQKDINGLGKRVEEAETEGRMQTAWRIETREDRIRKEEELKGIRERLTAQETALKTFTETIHEHHRDVRTLIEVTGRAQMEAVHKVELEVAKLSERGSIGESMKDLAKAILAARE